MSNKMFVYISCWEHLGGAPGIGIYAFDKETGALEPLDVVRKDLSCGTTFVDERRGILYMCIEEEDHPAYRKGGGGRIIAFRPDPETGALTQIDEAATLCPNPTYMCMSADGRYLVVSNHSSHNAVTKVARGEDGKFHNQVVFDDSIIDLFEIHEDGTIGDILDVAYHFGESVRRLHPHPHCAVMSPSDSFVVVCDKGNDRIYTYSIDREREKLCLCGEPFQDISGSSPRYCCFHPTLPYLYVNYEGIEQVGIFRYEETGKLSFVAYVNGVPADCEYPKGKGQSGILMHPSGKYVYDIFKMTASIAVFRVDEETGLLSQIQYMQSQEERLRAFQLSPDGKFLIATCIKSGGIETFAVGPDGLLSPTGHRQELHGAAYVTFFDPKD